MKNVLDASTADVSTAAPALETVSIRLPEDHAQLLRAFARHYGYASLESYLEFLCAAQLRVDAEGVAAEFQHIETELAR